MNAVRSIQVKDTFSCTREEMWQKWTTEEGVKSFFADYCLVEGKVGGAFELYFMIDNEKGGRGSEGCKFLALEENNFISFSWNAPPMFPSIRKQHTFVTLHLRELANGTELELNHYGWGAGDEWTKVYNYFSAAWPEVFESLHESLE